MNLIRLTCPLRSRPTAALLVLRAKRIREKELEAEGVGVGAGGLRGGRPGELSAATIRRKLREVDLTVGAIKGSIGKKLAGIGIPSFQGIQHPPDGGSIAPADY